MVTEKKLDEKTLKESWNVTSEIYEKACKEVGYTNQEVRYLWSDSEITLKEANRRRYELDEVYRKLLCKLPTHVLNILVKAWESGQQKRNPKTIDSVVTELFERELNESKETNKNNSDNLSSRRNSCLDKL